MIEFCLPFIHIAQQEKIKITFYEEIFIIFSIIFSNKVFS